MGIRHASASRVAVLEVIAKHGFVLPLCKHLHDNAPCFFRLCCGDICSGKFWEGFEIQLTSNSETLICDKFLGPDCKMWTNIPIVVYLLCSCALECAKRQIEKKTRSHDWITFGSIVENNNTLPNGLLDPEHVKSREFGDKEMRDVCERPTTFIVRQEPGGDSESPRSPTESNYTLVQLIDFIFSGKDRHSENLPPVLLLQDLDKHATEVVGDESFQKHFVSDPKHNNILKNVDSNLKVIQPKDDLAEDDEEDEEEEDGDGKQLQQGKEEKQKRRRGEERRKV